MGLVALTLAFFGGLIKPGAAEAVSRCHFSVETDSPEDGEQPVDCRGQHSGPWRWPTADDVPEPDVDIELTY